jgi:hypothetical protein
LRRAGLRGQQKLETLYAAYAEPDADFDQLAGEQARLDRIECVCLCPRAITSFYNFLAKLHSNSGRNPLQ